MQCIQRSAMQPNIPAVVILGQLNGLGVIRSLRRGGVPIYVADCDRFSAGMWLHYTQSVLSRDLEREELVDALLRLHATLGERPVLFNTHEMAVLTISKHRGKLDGAFRFRLPSQNDRRDRTTAGGVNGGRSPIASSQGCRISDAFLLTTKAPLARLTRHSYLSARVCRYKHRLLDCAVDRN
jgi:hypothetical protein